MRKFLLVGLVCLFVSSFISAQATLGTIYGTITDADGTPLPGVTVVLTSDVSGRMVTLSNENGEFRFPKLAPSAKYVVTAELDGFKKTIAESIAVSVGKQTRVSLKMETGLISENIQVIGTAAKVDTKDTNVGMVMTQQELQSLPTARDPWSVLAMAPGVVMDRQNVGGSESGQQAMFVARGAQGYNNNIWNMDGVNFTDPSAIGGSPTYFDFDAFEEMSVGVSGGDVTSQTAGVQMNMTTRRGGNKHSLGGRYYYTDQKFQADNLTDDLKNEIAATLGRNVNTISGVNKIDSIMDYGFNLGGPIFKDKVFYWFSVGNMNIDLVTLNGNPNRSKLSNYAGKFNFDIIPNNRLEFFIHAGGKSVVGRDASPTFPSGMRQGGQYHFGSPVLKIQDDLTLGEKLYFTFKYAFTDAGFTLRPEIDLNWEKMPIYDRTSKAYTGSYWNYDVKRPKSNYNVGMTYYADNLFGASHEIRAGLEYMKCNQEQVWEDPRYNYTSRIDVNFDTPQLDLNSDTTADIPTGYSRLYACRPYQFTEYLSQISVFLQDTVSFGKFTLKVGLRLDNYIPELKEYSIEAVYGKDQPRWANYFTSAAVDKIQSLIPGVTIPGNKPDLNWNIFSPRLGLTWDINGNGRTVAKLSMGIYGDVMGTGFVSDNLLPYGAEGYLSFWLKDTNGNGLYDVQELLWVTPSGNAWAPTPAFDANGNLIGDKSAAYKYGLYGYYDIDNPNQVYDPFVILDDSIGSSKTFETVVSLEKQLLEDFVLTTNVTYRKQYNLMWKQDYYPESNQAIDESWYIVGGTIPDTVGNFNTGDASGRSWYYLNPSQYTRTDYELFTNRDDYSTNYWGLDLIATKRLSNKWMLSGSLTLQAQTQSFGSKGYANQGYESGIYDSTADENQWNPTNKWADSVYSAGIGSSSGKVIDQFVFSRWMFSLGGLYQLPWETNVSATFVAREGNIVDEYFTIHDDRIDPVNGWAHVRTKEFGSERMPAFLKMDLRLEKRIAVSEGFDIFLMADCFNALNSNVKIQQYQRKLGDYYADTDTFVPNSKNGSLLQIMNPRVFRFGIRFQF